MVNSLRTLIITFFICFLAIKHCYAKNLVEINFRIIIPQYIRFIERISYEERINETVLAQYLLAQEAPELKIAQHKENAARAFIDDMVPNRDVFSVTSRSVFKVALQHMPNSDLGDYDKECYAELLERVYSGFGSVPEDEIQGVKARISAFALGSAHL